MLQIQTGEAGRDVVTAFYASPRAANHWPFGEPFSRSAVTFKMARTKSKRETAPQAADAATLAKSLAPEEIRRGDYLAVLDETFEYPSWYWGCDAALAPREEPVRIRTLPRDDALPLEVRAACLPFVLVRDVQGRVRTLDVRRCRLARLDRHYAVAARKAAKRCGGKPK